MSSLRPQFLHQPRHLLLKRLALLLHLRRAHIAPRRHHIPELPDLLEGSGRLELVDGERSELLGADYRFHYSDGHTPGLLLTELASDDGPILFAGDLVPGAAWVHLPITMGYDRSAEQLIDGVSGKGKRRWQPLGIRLLDLETVDRDLAEWSV